MKRIAVKCHAQSDEGLLLQDLSGSQRSGRKSCHMKGSVSPYGGYDESDGDSTDETDDSVDPQMQSVEGLPDRKSSGSQHSGLENSYQNCNVASSDDAIDETRSIAESSVQSAEGLLLQELSGSQRIGRKSCHLKDSVSSCGGNDESDGNTCEEAASDGWNWKRAPKGKLKAKICESLPPAESKRYDDLMTVDERGDRQLGLLVQICAISSPGQSREGLPVNSTNASRYVRAEVGCSANKDIDSGLQSVEGLLVQSGKGFLDWKEKKAVCQTEMAAESLKDDIWNDDNIIDVATPPDALLQVYLDKIPRAYDSSSRGSEYTVIEEANCYVAGSRSGSIRCEGYQQSVVTASQCGSDSVYEVVDEVLSTSSCQQADSDVVEQRDVGRSTLQAGRGKKSVEDKFRPMDVTNNPAEQKGTAGGNRKTGGMDFAGRSDPAVRRNLIIGDSNIFRMAKMMNSVDGLTVKGINGLMWRGVDVDVAVFDSNNRYDNIIVYIGINDVYEFESGSIGFGLENLNRALIDLGPEDPERTGHVWIINPHMVNESMELYQDWRTVKEEIRGFVQNLDSSTDGSVFKWHYEEIPRIFLDHQLLVEQYPSQRHLTPFGLEKLLDICMQHLPYRESDVHLFDVEQRLQNRYRHSMVSSLFSDPSRGMFRDVNAKHKLSGRCYVTIVRFAEIFDIPIKARGEELTQMECFTRTCYPLKQFRAKISSKRKKGVDKQLDLVEFRDNLYSTLQKKDVESSFCEVCTQYLQPDVTPFYEHVDKPFHRQSHVIVAVAKLMDEEAGSTVFDRLAHQTEYKLGGVGSDLCAWKEIRQFHLSTIGMRLRMEVDVRVQHECVIASNVEVELVHVGNLPGIVVTVVDQFPLRPISIPIDIQVKMFGLGRSGTKCFCPASAVVCCAQQGGKCTSWRHVTTDYPVNLQGDNREREVYVYRHNIVVKAYKKAGGLIYDFVEVWTGALINGYDCANRPSFSDKSLVVPSASINFLVGVNYVGAEVRRASYDVIADAKDSLARPSRSFSGHHTAGKVVHLHTPKMEMEAYNPAKSSRHLFKHAKAGHQKILDASFKIFHGAIEDMKQKSSGDVLAKEFVVDASIEAVDSIGIAKEMSSFANGGVDLLNVSAKRCLELNRFWPFFSNVLGMFILDRDGRQQVPWLMFDKVGIDEDPADRTMKIYVHTAERRWFTTVPDCLSMEYDDGSLRQRHFLRVRNAVQLGTHDNAYLEIEEDTSITEPEMLAKIMKSRNTITFFQCKDIFMSLRVFTDLTQTVVSDKKLVLKTTSIKGPDKDETKPETMKHNLFRDTEDPHAIDGQEYVRGMIRLQSRGRAWEVKDFESARLNRSRLLSAIDVISPGAGCGDLTDHHVGTADDAFIGGFGGAQSDAFDQYGCSLHRFIVDQVRAMPWMGTFREDRDTEICDATSSNGKACRCSVTKDSIIDIVFQRVVTAPRFAVLEGPVGTGKTYILSRVVFKLHSFYQDCYKSLEWIDDRWSPQWIQQRVLSPKFFILSTTNSNVETTKEYIFEAGVPVERMLHFVSRKQDTTDAGKTGVLKVFVPSASDEQLSANLFSKSVDRSAVIFSTVDLACGYFSRLRLQQNVYIFLDEAAQVSIVNGMYLMMFCDYMVLFGDPYQTEPYLDVENSIMKSFNVDVSIMELIVKALEAQGTDVRSKHCVRTYFNFRSTGPQCRVISETCYPDKHPLRAVVADERLNTTRLYRDVVPVLKQVLGLNSLDTIVLNVNGSMFTLPNHSHYNMEEATAVISLLRDIEPFMEDLTRQDDPNPVTVAVLTLYDGMEQLLKIACKLAFNGSLPFWLRILSIRVSQGQTFSYVILPLIESCYSDEFVAPMTRRAFTGDRRMLTVAISRQTHGLIIVTNPHRFILDEDSPVSKILRCLSERGLYFEMHRDYSASASAFFSWIVNLNLYYPGQYEAISLTLARLLLEIERNEPTMNPRIMDPNVGEARKTRLPIRNRLSYDRRPIYVPLRDVSYFQEPEERYRRYNENRQRARAHIESLRDDHSDDISDRDEPSAVSSGMMMGAEAISSPVQRFVSLREETVAGPVSDVVTGGGLDLPSRGRGRGRARRTAQVAVAAVGMEALRLNVPVQLSVSLREELHGAISGGACVLPPLGRGRGRVKSAAPVQDSRPGSMDKASVSRVSLPLQVFVRDEIGADSVREVTIGGASVARGRGRGRGRTSGSSGISLPLQVIVREETDADTVRQVTTGGVSVTRGRGTGRGWTSDKVGAEDIRPGAGT